MAKITQLHDRSWFVAWHPDLSWDIHMKSINFNINGCESSVDVSRLNDKLFLRVKLTASSSCLPVGIKVFINGDVLEMEELDRGCWKSAATPLLSFHKMSIVLIFDFPSKEERLIKRMSNLLENGNMADITFIVRNERIKAHKAIVSSASSVMAAMFEPNKFREGISQSVEITDVDPDIFRQLLLYIYTGTVPLSDQESMTEPLILAADKYLVDGLKEACENKISSVLSHDNVIHFLVIAHLHNAPNLLESAFQYLVKHQNEVRKSAEWKKLFENYKDLFFLATERICSNLSCSRCDQAAPTPKGKLTIEEPSDDDSSEYLYSD